MSANQSRLDANQVIKQVFDQNNEALKTISAGGTLVPDNYNEIDLSYYVAGPAQNQIQTVTYKLAGNTIATLTLTYDGAGKLITVVRS